MNKTAASTSSKAAPTSFLDWIRRVYFLFGTECVPLYLMTPGERIAVNLILLIFTALCVSATIAYIPKHTTKLTQRMYYYYSGDNLTAII